MPKNRPKIYTKPPNGGWWNRQKELALLETWRRYWQKDRVKRRLNSVHVYPRLKQITSRELKQIATAGATAAALTEKVWGEYVAAVCQMLAKWGTKMAETWTKEFKISFI